MKVTLRCYVTGRVQGVWFRGATRERAQALGISGYARNLPDGRVEVLASGEQAAVESLRSWLWQGPPRAEVEAVECQPADEPVADGFFTC